MNTDAKEQAQMHSRREWGSSKTKTLQANLIDSCFFLPIPAGWDHPCQSGKSVVDFYTEGRSEKHLRDIQRILETQSELKNIKKLEEFISDHSLNDIWNTSQR